uniref:EF-hand domain-containing protein n=1 Tax=Chromera velia CCMP2878 TaxID=1169474 RepID=A0A0G4I1X0_9ALVE|eukprot:Cvel_10209.t1-p1 / transcript=Cvel_10209.t1 / gene=Cvel_10209 / organism=Chromera_velia_CCMP2878 / gene_product=hypothetical protein / transcript_product=hypothetical protein / location=Cvel_scaffold611:12213-21691(+) / protein_length=1089 / sequence_SO=supercontig / SO=protein_coding / is_pseudo=false
MAAAAAASPRTPGGPGGDDPDRTSWLYEDDELVSTFLKTTGSSGMSYQHADIKRFCTILRSLDVDRDAIRRAYDVFVVTCPTIIQPPENLFWSIREEEERLAREEYERALEMGLKVPKPKAKAKAKKDKGMPTTAKGIQRYVTKGITADDLISRFKKHEKGAADELRQDIWTYYQSLFTAEEDSWILENCSSFTEAKPKEFLEHCRNSLGRLLDSGVPSGLLDIPEKSAITSEQLQERSESLKKEAPNRFQLLSRQSTLDSHFPLREGEKRVCDVPALRQLLQGFYEMKLGLEALGNPATAAAAAATGVKGKGQQKGAVQSGKRNSKEGANASQGTHTEGRRRSSDGSGVDGSQAVGGPPNVDSILTGGMDKPNADMTSKSLYPADHRFEADGTLKGAAAAGGGGEGDGEAGDADADGDADAASVFTFCSGSDTSAAEWLRILDPEMLAWLSQGSKKMSVEVPRYGQKGRTAVITCPFELVCEQSPRLARLYRRALERKAQLQAEEDNDPVEAAAHKGARDEESEVEFEDVDDIPLHMGSVYEAQLHNLNERERQELRVQCKEVVKFVLRKHKSLGEAFGALGIKDGTELDLQMFVEAVSVWGISKQFCERVFSLMDVDRSGTLSLPEISQFFHDLVANNVDVPRISLVEQFRKAAEFFSKVDMNGSGNVNVWEFKSALERFDPPKLQGESDVMAQFRMRVLEQFSTVDGAFEAFAAAGDRETGLKRRDFFKALKRLQMSQEFMAALGNSHFRRAVDGCPAFISDEFFKRFLGFVRAPEASFVVTRLRDLKKSLDGILEKVSKAVRVEVKKEFEAYGQRLADLEAQAINRSVEEVNRHMAAILQTIERQRQSLLEAFSVHVRALAQLHRMKLQECYQAETFQWRQRLLKFSEGLHKLLEHAIDDEGKATKAVIPEGGDLVLFLLLTDWLECKRLKDFLLRQLVKEFDALAFDEVWQREETAKAMGPLFMKEIVSRIPAETLLSDAGDGGLLLDALTPDRFEFKWSLGPLVLQELKQRRHLAREVYTGWGTDMLLSAKYNKLVAFRGELEHVIRERRRTAGPVKLKSEGAASDVEIFRGKAKLLTNRSSK